MDSNQLKLKIVTPDGVIYEGENLEFVTIPTTAGVVTIKDDHIPLVSLVNAGEIIIGKEKHEVNLAVAGGAIEVKRNSEIYILADTAERAEDIDLERAEEARKRAEEFLAKQEDIADVDFARLQAKIQKELARISVATKYRG